MKKTYLYAILKMCITQIKSICTEEQLNNFKSKYPGFNLDKLDRIENYNAVELDTKIQLIINFIEELKKEDKLQS